MSFWGSEGILPDGVKQGGLGDCWFLSSAAALAEHPARIEKVFDGSDPNGGFYVVEFYFLGEKQYITVDDRLPCETAWWYYDETSLFNSGISDKGAWWLPVLEKGFAKYFMNYLAMDGGWETVALRALTGMPCDRF